MNFFIFHHLISILPTPVTVTWRMFYSHCVCASKDTYKKRCISIPRVFLNWTPNVRDLWLNYKYTVHFPKSQPFIKSCTRYTERDKIIWQRHYILLIFSPTFLYSTPSNNFQDKFIRKLSESTKPLPNYMLNT